MADFYVNGECFVKVYFGGHISGSISGSFGIPGGPSTPQRQLIKPLSGDGRQLFPLGLTADSVRIAPLYYHQDVKVSDFGPRVPAETLANLYECQINMSLIYYEPLVLETCLAESMAGGTTGTLNAGAGKPLGAYKQRGLSGWHYVGLNISSPIQNEPWRFLSCYLSQQPIIMPLGSEKSIVHCSWRAIPYVQPVSQQQFGTSGSAARFVDLLAQGTVVWDHTPDT